jgi:hypothetical protein
MLSGTPGILGRGATLGAPQARLLAESASVTCLGGPPLVRRARSYLPPRRRLGSGEYEFPSNHSSAARWPPQEAATWRPPCHHLARRPRRRVFVPSVHRPEPATPAVTITSPRDVSFTCGLIETCG